MIELWLLGLRWGFLRGVRLVEGTLHTAKRGRVVRWVLRARVAMVVGVGVEREGEMEAVKGAEKMLIMERRTLGRGKGC